MVAIPNTGLNGALGLSTQNSTCLAARREAWSPSLGVHEGKTTRISPSYGLNFPNLALRQVVEERGQALEPCIFGGTTDSRRFKRPDWLNYAAGFLLSLDVPRIRHLGDPTLYEPCGAWRSSWVLGPLQEYGSGPSRASALPLSLPRTESPLPEKAANRKQVRDPECCPLETSSRAQSLFLFYRVHVLCGPSQGGREKRRDLTCNWGSVAFAP